MKHTLAVAALWVIAIAATIVIVADRSVFSYLGPLYAVCMIGSVVIVKRASARPPAV